YTLTVAAVDADGAEKASVTDSFELPQVTWADAPTFEGVVPEPWTPIERDGSTLRVWGRGHQFADGPLPGTVTSQDQDILSGPARLLVNSEEPSWSGGDVASEAPDAVERQGTGAAGEIAIDWRTRMEFDGMLRCDLTLMPVGERTEVQSLALELPVTRECGEYVLAPVMQEWDGVRIAMDWRDMVWLTGHEAGICWFAESDANWIPGEDAPPIVVERAGDTTTLTLMIIGKPVTIEGPVSYTFGLQATPTRPLPEDWRNLNVGNPNQVEGARTTLVAQGGGCFKRNAYLVPAEHVDMDAVMERWSKWGRPLPYSTPTFLADHTALWDFYQRAWRNSERHSYVGYTAHDGTEYALQATCPRSDFSEVMVHWVDDLLEDYPEIGGIYYDCCSATECLNSEHDCGGVDAFGRPYATRPIFDLRDVLRRVLTIAHSHGDIVMNHAHSRFYPPIHGFGDYWFPGEQYTTRLGEDIWYYTDRIPPEVWQIELNSQVRGVGISFLPEFGRGTDDKYQREAPAPSKALLAACMVHDVPCSGHWIHPKEIEKVWELYDRHWLSDATFFGYWNADCPVSVEPPLRASAYVTDDATVVVVSNLTPQPAEGTLRFNGEERDVSVGARDYVVEVKRDE
ncbi:MAG: glycoside hydrolase domain-containing protein, partial [Armatimonadota bacterium]